MITVPWGLDMYWTVMGACCRVGKPTKLCQKSYEKLVGTTKNENRIMGNKKVSKKIET